MNNDQVGVILIGLGQVGKGFLRQFPLTSQYLHNRYGIKPLLIGVADSSGLLWNKTGFNDRVIQEIILHKENKKRLQQFDKTVNPAWKKNIEAMLSENSILNPIIVDATATNQLTELFINLAERRHRIVFANKIPFSEDQKIFDSLTNSPFCRYEATVGAALPILASLDRGSACGDMFLKIQGCLSGTIGFLMSELQSGKKFSEAVKNAHQRGYTEPDPRLDLSGKDVARKVTILARTIGMDISINDFSTEKLYDNTMESMPMEKFMNSLHCLDTRYKEMNDEAQKEHKVLRYVAQISQKGCSVGLQSVDKDSLMGNLQGTDNIVVIHSKLNQPEPLVIRGQGAGPDITASALLSDLAELALLDPALARTKLVSLKVS